MRGPGPFGVIVGATLVLVAALEIGSNERNNPLAIGADAPPFALPRLDRPMDSIRLADLRGKVVLLETWNTACANCRSAMPAADSLGRRYADAGLVVIHIAGQDLSDSLSMRRFLNDNAVTGVVLVDDHRGFNASYQAWGVPWSVLVDRAGKVAWQHAGMVNGAAHPLLTERGEALLQGILDPRPNTSDQTGDR